MIEYETILKPLIKNFTFNEEFKYDGFKKENVIEVHLSSSSVVRKDFTMNRIKNLISKHNLSLKVFDDNEFSDRFIIST